MKIHSHFLKKQPLTNAKQGDIIIVYVKGFDGKSETAEAFYRERAADGKSAEALFSESSRS